MRAFRLLGLAVTAEAVVAGGAAPTAAAGPFGDHVAMCAHQLGHRADAPAVTCTHDGVTMTFPNFGAMVEHMRQIH